MADAEVPRAQWLRGVLDLCLLGVVDAEPAYGYEMTRRLDGLGLAVADGSIYPALGRLRRVGLVEVFRRPGEAGPPRTYYRTTTAGREALVGWRQAWTEFATGVGRAVDGGRPGGAADPGAGSRPGGSTADGRRVDGSAPGGIQRLSRG
jgi:PadR family transcriptional regulator PadR